MKTYLTFVEALDTPYPYKTSIDPTKGRDPSKAQYKFGKGKDQVIVDVTRTHWHGETEEPVWDVNFQRGGSIGKTGQGDSLKIFATVLDILKKFVKDIDPSHVNFAAEKAADDKGSRSKLYMRLAKKYFGKKYSVQTDISKSSASGDETMFFSLDKK
jgi:hypothetical protein